MHQLHIDAMAKILVEGGLVPQHRLAEAASLLAAYWEDRHADVWHISDVQDHAEESLKLELSNDDARQVFGWLEKNSDASLGVNWNLIEEAVRTLDVGMPIEDDEDEDDD